MSKKEILVLIILVLAVVGGLFYSSKGSIKRTDLESEPESTQSSDMATTSAKFDHLIIEYQMIGEGPDVKSGDTVSVHYKGTLVDGTQFDSSYDRGAPFETQIGVGAVIAGWDQGIVGMKKGGKRVLKIPSQLGYGERGAGADIPPNSDLIFEVELLEIK